MAAWIMSCTLQKASTSITCPRMQIAEHVPASPQVAGWPDVDYGELQCGFWETGCGRIGSCAASEKYSTLISLATAGVAPARAKVPPQNAVRMVAGNVLHGAKLARKPARTAMKDVNVVHKAPSSRATHLPSSGVRPVEAWLQRLVGHLCTQKRALARTSRLLTAQTHSLGTPTRQPPHNTPDIPQDQTLSRAPHH